MHCWQIAGYLRQWSSHGVEAHSARGEGTCLRHAIDSFRIELFAFWETSLLRNRGPSQIRLVLSNTSRFRACSSRFWGNSCAFGRAHGRRPASGGGGGSSYAWGKVSGVEGVGAMGGWQGWRDVLGQGGTGNRQKAFGPCSSKASSEHSTRSVRSTLTGTWMNWNGVAAIGTTITTLFTPSVASLTLSS